MGESRRSKFRRFVYANRAQQSVLKYKLRTRLPADCGTYPALSTYVRVDSNKDSSSYSSKEKAPHSLVNREALARALPLRAADLGLATAN